MHGLAGFWRAITWLQPCNGGGVRLARQTLEQRPSLRRSNDENDRSRAARLLAPRVPANDVHEPTTGPPQRREASAERRGCRYRGPDDKRCRLSVRSSRRALPFGKTRSPLGALPRLSPVLRPAQSGPALHGSANGFNSVRHPGSQLLADRRRGRPGEFPNRLRAECIAPPAGTALAPLRGVPSAERPSHTVSEVDACSIFGDVVK